MMISINKYSKAMLAGMTLLTVVSCSNPWDDHSANSDENIEQTLGDRLTNDSQTTEFGKLLEETGYDRILSGSKTYTVWPPTNEALASVPQEALSDMKSKKLFVQNHITLTAFSSVSEQDTVTVQMLSNKYLEFKNGAVIFDANVITTDQYASNGLYHVIDKALVPQQNVWEYLKSNAGNKMSSYLLSLDEFNIYQSDSTAKVRAKSEPGLYADSLSNSYLKNVLNLNNEKNKYTFFLLEDDGYDAEVEKLKPYLIKSNEDSTTTYTSYFTARDYVFHKAIARENLPDTLESRFGVKVPIDTDNIVEEVHLSNGVVYVMSTLDVPLETRLLTTQIEGEDPEGFSHGDKRGNTYYREKEDLNGILFYDIMVQNHGEPEFAIYYNTRDLYSTTYEVYWRAINDIQENTFEQRLRFGGTFDLEGEVVDPIATLDYTDVGPDVYDEIFIGEFTLEESGDLDLISLIAANTGSNGDNTLTLDYLKLVPVIK
ncbi:fasciclin domain-containing protein [Galbibacter sp. EGI 63066]|uniref:fasciclin domain-containing protein n=1 Tax=Galbibacter sp. EGI 63066 TaxID=2993559 RepID=UPI002249329B|nr:fasciclin domain-containing protein [Galbibacter sp. EGI 63066]